MPWLAAAAALGGAKSPPVVLHAQVLFINGLPREPGQE